MRLTRIAGLCLVAIVAVSVVACATASAEAPEFGRCLKKTVKSLPGYTTSKCTVQAEEAKEGSYEWVPGAVAGENKLSRSGGLATLLATSGESITCESEESTGAYIVGGNNKEMEISMRFKGCKTGGLSCTTVGLAAGELEMEPLIGIVGFEKEPKETDTTRTTLLQLHAASTGGHFIDFKCSGGITYEMRGNGPKEGILVPIKNDAMKSEEELKYTQSKGIQKPTTWFPPLAGFGEEQFLELNIQGTHYVQLGWSHTTKIKNEGGVKYELNAFV